MGPMDTGIDSSSLVWPLEGRFSSTLIPDRYTARPPETALCGRRNASPQGCPRPCPANVPCPERITRSWTMGPPAPPQPKSLKSSRADSDDPQLTRTASRYGWASNNSAFYVASPREQLRQPAPSTKVPPTPTPAPTPKPTYFPVSFHAASILDHSSP